MMSTGLSAYRCIGTVLACTAFLLCPTRARADYDSSGSSNAYSVTSSLTLTISGGSSVSGALGLLPFANATAPAPYNNTAQLGSLNVTAGPFGPGNNSSVLSFISGLLVSNVTSNVDGLPGTRTTTASSTSHGLTSSVINIPTPPSYLGITGTTIGSTAQVTGVYGSLVGSGTTTVDSLIISLLGTNIYASGTGSVAVAANTAVTTGVTGLSILLNEQFSTGNGISSLDFTTNAIDIKFTNVAIGSLGTVSGSLLFGHSDAKMTAVQSVPEPSSLLMLGAMGCIGGLATAFKRNRRGCTVSA